MLPGKSAVTRGRELDPRLAVLTGEGARQKIRHPEPVKGSPAVAVWHRLPSGQEESPRNYYGVPLLKEPVWIWSVPAYFYVGGVAGGSALLASLISGRKEFRGLAATCRLLAFIGTTIGPGLLTWDLGRRFRFVNMLRVFRPSSPMSVGSWSLAGTGMLASLALLHGDRPLPRPVSWSFAGGGLMLAGYTGVLLANSANPVWQGARYALPVLFTASSMASTSGVLELLPLNEREEAVVNGFGKIGKFAEAGAMMAVEREVASNPEAAEAFREGKAGVLWRMSKWLLAAGIVAGMLPERFRWKKLAGGALTTAGAVSLRFALLSLGKQAAANSRAVMKMAAP